ncbi:MAG TPA: cysteine peptidase family C39 domain-containing protein [Gemmataceae bacterium]
MVKVYLSDLRDASTRYGLPVEVRRCIYEQLAGGCPLPLIALLHMKLETADRLAGHYVLVIGADLDGVTVVDGTSGKQKRYRRDAFCRSWEGYVVMPTEGQSDWLLLLAISTTVWMLAGWLMLRANRSGIRTSRSAGSEAPTDARAK